MSPPSTSPPSLVAQGLQVRFPTGFVAGPLDLDLGPGIAWLQGDNGTGKTTLLRALCGELRPTAGEVRICGADPHRDPLTRRHVGFLPTTLDTPEYLRVDEAWQTVAALRRAPDWDGHALRDALDLPGRLRVGHASAGQRRKIELLCALAGEPPVLLLDEPFAHVDAATIAWLVAALEGWRGERVVLLTSHEPHLPVAADRVLRL